MIKLTYQTNIENLKNGGKRNMDNIIFAGTVLNVNHDNTAIREISRAFNVFLQLKPCKNTLNERQCQWEFIEEMLWAAESELTNDEYDNIDNLLMEQQRRLVGKCGECYESRYGETCMKCDKWMANWNEHVGYQCFDV